MNLRRRTAVASILLAPLLAAAGHEGGPGAPEYIELKPEQPVDAPGKLEVVEFFWYGCPHCYKLEPLLESWVPKLPGDVVFRRVPAIFNERWARDAAIFYTFEALGLTQKLHRPLFDAIHRDRLRTDDAKSLAAWLGRNGVDAARFEQTLKSFGVQTRVQRSKQLSIAYKLEGVPTLAVHGRYTIPSGRGFEAMLKTAEELIGATRKNLAQKK